jgi:hypothetical protein
MRRFPRHGWLGLGLVAVMWPLLWRQAGFLADFQFFFLWLGYILTVDGLVVIRRGDSLLTRDPWAFAALFVISAPVWWLFEFFNGFVQNWHYLGAETYSRTRYITVATVSFSTVIPAVFESAELMATFGFVQRFRRGPVVPATRPVLIGAMAFGALSIPAFMLWPRYAFPLVWTCLFFLLDPINYRLGWPSITAWVSRGDWRPVAALWCGALLTGFFWELWNFYAWPKWVYTVPFVDFWHVFEMPLLGYSGYLPFSLELFAIYHFVRGVAGTAQESYPKVWAT